MMQITIPKSNDFRRFFNPVILILMSIVLNTFFQLYTSEEEWNSFFIFNQKPDYTVFFISLVFYLFFLFGAFFAYLFNYQKHSNHRSHYLYNFSFYNGLLKFVFYSNVISLIVTQYYMHEANIYNIYISGGVSAQTIESQIASSPLGIHGISV
ncbi:O90/O127 family O-antigen polymerase, partial [Escherichia coli]